MAKTLLEHLLTEQQYRAIRELKMQVIKYFDVDDIIMFGSVAR
jgi:predicted nucleotidyltransferase